MISAGKKRKLESALSKVLYEKETPFWVKNKMQELISLLVEFKSRLDGFVPKEGQRGERGEKGDSIVGPKGERGETGPRGEKGDRGEMGFPGPKGEPGIRGERGERGEKGEKGETSEIDTEEIISLLIEEIKKKRPIDISHIRNSEQFMFNGKRYKISELMHGGGSISGNLLTPISGNVNGTNRTFVFLFAPSVIIVDGGRAIKKTSSDGTVNWTGNTTITLSVAPTFDLIALR